MPSVILAGTTTGTALSLTSDTSGELQIRTNNGSTTAMTLTTGGNVGVGTTSPTQLLTVNGNGRFISSSGNRYVVVESGNTSSVQLATDGTASYVYGVGTVPLILATNSAERMRIDSSGNVGIGTTSPVANRKLTIGNTGQVAAMRINAPTGYDSFIEFTENNSLTANEYWQINKIPTTHALQFWNGSERMRITSTGNVGIGTNNPQQLLDLYGSGGLTLIQIQGSAGVCGYFGGANTSGSGVLTSVARDMIIRGEGSNILFSFSNVEAARINANGNFVLKGGSTGASGVGVTFPATQSASSDANTLDDYEEGTWTPAFDAASGSATYTTQQGTYTKIGRQVTAVFYIRVNVSSSLQSQNITGLPFTGSSTNYAGTAFSIWSGIGGYCTIVGLTGAATAIQIRSTNSQTSPPVLNTLSISNSAEIAGTITYFTS